LRRLGQEVLALGVLVAAALVAGWVLGHEVWFISVAAATYLTWHAVNLARLKWWLIGGRFRAPVSYGLWEGIFDDLQAVQLRNRRRKRALLDMLRQLRELAANMPDGVVLLDKRTRIRWFNPAAERLLGLNWPRDSLVGMTEVVNHPVLEDHLNAGGDARPVETPSPVNGAIMLSVEVSAIRGTDQRLLAARDITKTYNVERSRREFVANVSHELRTPLTVFRGYLEVLEDLAIDFPDLGRPVELLDQQSDRMNDLVEDLLRLSRLEFTDRPPSMEPVAVPELLDAIVDEAKGLSESRGHEFEIDVEPDLWLSGDKSTLRTTFTNLIVNAVKHTPAGTRITIEWARQENGCVLRVRDDGPGIAAYHLPRLTERFYRVDPGRQRARGGTGLGLAIVKHAIERHGGELKIASEPGKGSEFTCHFPEVLVVAAAGFSAKIDQRSRQSGAS